MNGYEWCADAAKILSERGIISGDGNGAYRPGDCVTREEMLKVLLSCFKLYDGEAVSAFSDVRPGEWYYGYVATGEKLGYINGMGDGSFGIGQFVTREDMAVMVYKIASENGVKLNGSDAAKLSDFDSVSDYAKTAVSALAANGIIVGTENGEFCPKNSCTRAETAVVVRRLLGL